MKHHNKFTWRNIIKAALWTFIILLAIVVPVTLTSRDFYELLGIERDASHKDIRRAFKKLALSMHPDKNPNDPKAHDKFVEINRAYEVLKDDDLRNKYDRFGEEGLKDQGQNQWNRYESWQFYKTEFGLYDEDPEIVTLSKTDFEQSVFGEDIWFVNFYSPRCHHCHDLAPTWREFAKEVEGVIRIGAVNCWDDNPVCTGQGVMRFPTLKIYPANQEFTGNRKLETLVKHALRLVKGAEVHAMWTGNFKDKLLDEKAKLQPWVISFCGAPDGSAEDTNEVATKIGCLDGEDQFKLAAILKGVVNIGSIDCVASSKLCEKLNIEDSTIKYYPQGKKVTPKGGMELEIDEPKHIANEVMKILPDITVIGVEEFQTSRSELRSGTSHTPMLTYFTKDTEEQSLELRKLPHLLTGFKVGKFNCTANGAFCDQLYLSHELPKVALFRTGGEYELHHGRLFAQDIAAFGRQSRFSKLHMLTPADFPDRVINSGDTWYVDFFSPHCPPCRQLIPELRTVSRTMHNIKFGTVDCTTHNALCNQQNVRSYPTSIMYNQTKPHINTGFQRAGQIIDFIEDTLNPKVVTLDKPLFDSLVRNRKKDDIWLVDFYAPWCGPCQALAPEWRKLAKMLNGSANIGSVDCVENSNLCQEVNVHSYPTVRLYPRGMAGISGTTDYRGWNRDANSLLGWAHSFLPSVVEVITQSNFRSKVLRSTEPWVLDFYSPWCGPCQQYMPQFEQIAKSLQGHVRFGKIDCNQWQTTCNQASIQSYPSVRLYKGTDTPGYSQNWYGEQIWNYWPQQLLPYLKQKFPNKLKSANVKDEL